MVMHSYGIIGRTIGVNCDQMMEFASKNQKGKPFWRIIRTLWYFGLDQTAD